MANMAREGILIPLEEHEDIKKKVVVSRSWVWFDAKGEKRVFDLDKYDIMRRMNIHARDLRVLDPLLSYPSTILGKERAIVLNLEHIKAIVTADEVQYKFLFSVLSSEKPRFIVLLRDPSEDNVIPIVEQLQRRLTPSISLPEGYGEDEDQHHSRNEEDGTSSRNAKFPFEFRVLEVLLEAICSFLDARTTELEGATYPALDELTSKISSRNLDRVRKLKSAMTRLTNRVQKVRDELEQLLDDNADMEDLYLSRKLSRGSSPANGSQGPLWYPASLTIGSRISKASRASTTTMHEENDVEELEMLLECVWNPCLMMIHAPYPLILQLREYIDNTEDYINIQLDNHRNQLIQLELLVSSGTVCLSVYSLVAAIFGMNIPYTWRENHDYIFKWVVLLTGMVCGTLFISIMVYARHKGLLGC
ncbi:Magnesium transporter MRS2-I-like protein [Drosera capensis]